MAAAAPAPGDFPAPFGRYTLLCRLGSGGMADALLAMLQGQMGFQKPVVIKRMHASLGRDSHFVRMFLDEAKLAARLAHPNVVTTSEVGECDGHYFIAMEYLEGASLDRVARAFLQGGSPVPMGLLLRVLCDSLEGLHYAHDLRDWDGTELRVVHRDVTPSNLFVTSGGVSKVLDFGIAKAATQDEATRTGMLKGKLAYMSPEQFYPDPVDRRADLWSMGVVVWEMTTGRRLFKGANDTVTYRNIVGAPVPPVGDFRPDAPRALDAVIARALTRDRTRRYATAEEMRVELEAVLRDHLGGTPHAEVARTLRERFGEALEENRRAIREFAQRQGGAPATVPASMLVPQLHDPDDDVSAAMPAAPDRVRPPTLAGPPPQLVTVPPNEDDEDGLSTIVDAKLPPSLAEAAAAVVARVPTLPPARVNLVPVAPVTPAPPAPRAPPVAPAQLAPADPDPPPRTDEPQSTAPAFDPIPAEVTEARAREARREAMRASAVRGIGWITLAALVGGGAWAVWSQRAFLARAADEVRHGTPPDPARMGYFQVRIVSSPPGARVFEGAVELGPTPLELPVQRGLAADHPREFRLQLPGYTTVTAVQRNTLEARVELRVTLSPVNPRRAPR